MSDVVEFPVRRKEVWVCGCGCMTFELLGSGVAACADCGTVQSSIGGYWFDEIEGGRRGSDEPKVRSVYGNGVSDLGLRRMHRHLDDDAVVVVVVKEDGAVSTYGEAEGREQRSWLKRRLIDAYRMLANDK